MQMDTTMPSTMAAPAKIAAITGSMTMVIIIDATNSMGARTNILMAI